MTGELSRPPAAAAADDGDGDGLMKMLDGAVAGLSHHGDRPPFHSSAHSQ